MISKFSGSYHGVVHSSLSPSSPLHNTNGFDSNNLKHPPQPISPASPALHKRRPRRLDDAHSSLRELQTVSGLSSLHTPLPCTHPQYPSPTESNLNVPGMRDLAKRSGVTDDRVQSGAIAEGGAEQLQGRDLRKGLGTHWRVDAGKRARVGGRLTQRAHTPRSGQASSSSYSFSLVGRQR